MITSPTQQSLRQMVGNLSPSLGLAQFGNLNSKQNTNTLIKLIFTITYFAFRSWLINQMLSIHY